MCVTSVSPSSASCFCMIGRGVENIPVATQSAGVLKTEAEASLLQATLRGTGVGEQLLSAGYIQYKSSCKLTSVKSPCRWHCYDAKRSEAVAKEIRRLRIGVLATQATCMEQVASR
jgi:hypothetical protein